MIRVDECLMVYETPLEWLKAGRRGVVLLNPDRARSILLAGQPLGVTNREFGFRLRSALTGPAPEILVARNVDEGAL
jgi:hypothetical protein